MLMLILKLKHSIFSSSFSGLDVELLLCVPLQVERPRALPPLERLLYWIPWACRASFLWAEGASSREGRGGPQRAAVLHSGTFGAKPWGASERDVMALGFTGILFFKNLQKLLARDDSRAGRKECVRSVGSNASFTLVSALWKTIIYFQPGKMITLHFQW